MNGSWTMARPADRVEWEERMRLGQHAFDKGNYKEAKRQFEKAVAIARDISDDGSKSVSLLNLGMTLGAAGRDDLADPVFSEALQIDEQSLGPGSRELAIDFIDIGAHYGRMSRLGEAEQMYKRALNILENESTKKPDTDLALVLSNLGLLYLEQNRPDDAEAPLHKALEIRQAAFAQNSKEVAESMVNLATLYSNTGRRSEAKQMYEQAIDTLEMQLGPDHPETAEVLQDYADLLRDAGDIDAAKQLDQRAQSILRSHTL